MVAELYHYFCLKKNWDSYSMLINHGFHDIVVLQVRMKAVCVLESILRKKDDEHFSTVESYFSENRDVVVRCSESPQASLREKANKVKFCYLFLLY